VSNLISNNNFIYFIAKDGFFYRVDVNNFRDYEKIVKVDNKPEVNKYMMKKSVLFGDKILLPSDTGKLFIYNTASSVYQFADPKDINENPLIGTPVVVDDSCYVLDTKANVYKFYGVFLE